MIREQVQIFSVAALVSADLEAGVVVHLSGLLDIFQGTWHQRDQVVLDEGSGGHPDCLL